MSATPGSHSPTLLGNTLYASVSAGSAGLLLVLLILAGRFLGDADYGKFSFALALATIFETAVDFGLKEITSRSVARDHGAARRLVANIFGLKLLLAGGTMLALIVAARALRPEPDVRLICYLLGGSAVLRSYLLTVRHLLTGLERFGLESLVVIADRLLLLGLGGGALALGYGVAGLSVAFVAARIVAVGIAYGLAVSQLGRIRPGFDVAFWRDLQLRALPFGAFAIVLYLYSYIDTVMLGVWRGDAETGLYSAAYRLYEGVSNVPSVLHLVLLPRLASYFVTDPARHRQLARTGLAIGTALAIPAAAVVWFLARPLVTWLFGEPFLPAAGVLQILAVGLLFVFPLFILHAEAIAADAEAALLRTGVIGCLVNIGLNSALIPSYGMHGAAAATVVSELTSVAVLLSALRRRPVRPGVS